METIGTVLMIIGFILSMFIIYKCLPEQEITEEGLREKLRKL